MHAFIHPVSLAIIVLYTEVEPFERICIMYLVPS